MYADHAYLFTHTLLREAAYQLQLPSVRRQLHSLAVDAIEACSGGAPPPPNRDGAGDLRAPPHQADASAIEVVQHLRRAGALGRDWRSRGYLMRAAARLGESWRHREACDHWQDLAGLLRDNDRVTALMMAASEADKAGDPQACERLAREAFAHARRGANWQTKRSAQCALAVALADNGREQEALKLMEEALAEAEPRADKTSLCRIRSDMAFVLMRTSDFPRAREVLRLALEGLGATDSPRLRAVIFGHLTTCCTRLGDVASAESWGEQALKTTHENNMRHSEAAVLSNLANVYRLTGREALAREFIQKAIEVARDVGNRRTEGVALGNLGVLQRMNGQIGLAFENHLQAVELTREVGDRLSEATNLNHLSNIALQDGKLDLAAQFAKRALDIYIALGNDSGAAQARTNLESAGHHEGAKS